MRTTLNSLAIKREALVILAVLIGAAITAPLLFKEQLITGTIVNATLFIGVSLLGSRDGLLIGLVPSSVALAAGLLSPFLAPMIPFIIAGNAILVLAFSGLKNINYWVGVIAGSLLKFGFLYGMSTIIIKLLVNEHFASAAAKMLSWPQLITALCGGVVAFVILKLIKKERMAY